LLLWMRTAWLSVDDRDASMRFRFSHGIPDVDDVALDRDLQRHSARLCESIFPESRLITESQDLYTTINECCGGLPVEFVERIIYFNAPEGGALFHHDVERGHEGVIFVQASGKTGWISMSTVDLLAAITDFAAQEETMGKLGEELGNGLMNWLEITSSNQETLLKALCQREDEIEALLNLSPSFAKYLIKRGYGYILKPGDGILLPQALPENCAWHSVFCLGDVAGEGLSFAIRIQD